MSTATSSLMPVAEAARRLGVSTSTVWRLLRRGELPSVRERGRRLIPERAVIRRAARAAAVDDLPPFTLDNPIFAMAGAGRSGGAGPGARDKHAILDT